MFHHHYKQKCTVCKHNMVLIRSYHQRPVCQECQMKAFETPITSIKFKRLFNINKDLYEQSPFLRDIRYQYARYGALSEKQIEAFKKVVKEVTEKPAGQAIGKKPGQSRSRKLSVEHIQTMKVAVWR